jgi:hypothetical protein
VTTGLRPASWLKGGGLPGDQTVLSSSSMPDLEMRMRRALESVPKACWKAFLLVPNAWRMAAGGLSSSRPSRPPVQKGADLAVHADDL